MYTSVLVAVVASVAVASAYDINDYGRGGYNSPGLGFFVEGCYAMHTAAGKLGPSYESDVKDCEKFGEAAEKLFTQGHARRRTDNDDWLNRAPINVGPNPAAQIFQAFCMMAAKKGGDYFPAGSSYADQQKQCLTVGGKLAGELEKFQSRRTTTSSGGSYDDLLDRIKALERRISELERTGSRK